MDCKENSSHLSLGEAHLFHPRSLDMGISIGNCCGSNGNGDANGVIINSLQGPGGTNLSISNFVAGNHPDVTRNSSRKRVFINEPKLFENRQCRHADIIISRRYLFITLVFLRNKHFINFIIVIKTLPSSFI